MNPFLAGFTAEIEKNAGLLTGGAKLVGKALKPVASTAARFPMFTIFGAAPAAMGAAKAYGGRLAGETGESIIKAKPFQPSPYHYANFHELFPHKLQPWERYKLHANRSPSMRRADAASAARSKEK